MRNMLEDHLAALRAVGKIRTWHDLELEAGTEWEPAILNKLDTADIILLLISSNFIASKYCYGTELKRALARHDAGEAQVIPIILRSCDWNHSDVPFSKLNVLPTHAKPIASWADPHDAFTIVARRIREIVNQIISPPPPVEPSKVLSECDPAKLLFIKNVKALEGWAYPLSQMEQPESRTFELMWRSTSHGVNLPKAGDLMILHQHAKVTHVVEFLDDQIRKADFGSLRWVRAVWIADQDWSQLPHQKEILGFSPNYADGNTHSLNSPNFFTFREAWSSLEAFQKHIFQRLTQSKSTITDEDILTSEKGVDYTHLRNLLKTGQWKTADQETSERMCEVMGRQQEGYLRIEDIHQFPSIDLRTIDQLWMKYSNGKFGFSIQKTVWQQCGNPAEYDKQWEKFGETVGWKMKGWKKIDRELQKYDGLLPQDYDKLIWKDYDSLTFDIKAPKGHLPISILYFQPRLKSDQSLDGFKSQEFSSFMQRFLSCSV